MALLETPETRTPDDAAPAVRPRHLRRSRWPARVALAASLAPFAVAAVVLVVVVDGDYRPWSDWALTELRTRDVGHHPVMLGPFSRGDWYHPGPALFYVLALPYRLTGGASVGVALGAVALNGIAVAGMALVARRLGGLPALLATLACCGVLVRALGPQFVRDAWNPTVTVLPYGLMLFLSWAMTCGRTWALPTGVAVASFLAQTHVGYAVLALPLLAWGAAWLAALAVRGRRRELPGAAPVAVRSLVGAGALAAVVLAVMWAPPLVQELRHDPGNLTAIARYFQSGDEPGHSLADGLRVVATQFDLAPDWIVGPEPLTITSEPAVLYRGAPVPWLLVPLALAAALLARRGPPEARRLLLTLGVAAGLGVVSVARTTGLAYAYRLQWSQVLAMAAGVVVVWATWLAAAPHLRRLGPLARRAPAVAVAAVAALAAVNTVGAARAGVPDEEAPAPSPGTPSAALAGLTAGIEGALPPGDGKVVVHASSYGSLLYMFGVLLDLERSGVEARVAPNYVQVGDHRHSARGPTRADVVLGVDEDIAVLRADPSLRQVALWGRVPPPRPPDDPTAEVEQLWVGGPAEQLRRIARSTVDRSADLPRPFEIHAVAAFVRSAAR